MELNREVAQRVLQTVDAGLVRGKGNPIPGQMCVEAAVCFAMGLPHSDEPKCVGSAVRAFKIRLNDAAWPSDQERAKGMRKLAIAQLGSDKIDQNAFRVIVVRETIRQLLPLTLRNAAKKNPKFADELEQMAKLCEENPTYESASKTSQVTLKVRNAAAADAYAYAYAAAAAAAYAAYAAYAADAAYAAAVAAYAAAADAADAADRLAILQLSAKIGLDALIELKSPGCEWLDLCN